MSAANFGRISSNPRLAARGSRSDEVRLKPDAVRERAVAVSGLSRTPSPEPRAARNEPRLFEVLGQLMQEQADVGDEPDRL
jgi:hypothetical protein